MDTLESANSHNVKNYNFFAYELLISIGLTLILWKAGRVLPFLGIGELLVFIAVYFGLILYLLNHNKIIINDIGKYYALVALFYFGALVPMMSLINYGRVPGVNLINIFAYLLSCSLIFVVAMLRMNTQRIATMSLYFIIAFTFLTVVFGGSDIWYHNRFIGPAENPNRLALYAISLLVLTPQIRFNNKFLLTSVFLVCLLILIQTGSDASRLGLAAGFISYIFFLTFRSIYFGPITFLILVLSTLFIIWNFELITITLTNLWYLASSGDYRINLLLNGIEAWTSNFISLFFGFGAGVYSGFAGPFQGWEAHSTLIDMLTIAGILGTIIFYFPAAYSIVVFVRHRKNFLAALIIAIIIFSLFNYIGRHPIYWLTMFISMVNANALTKKLKNDTHF